MASQHGSFRRASPASYALRFLIALERAVLVIWDATFDYRRECDGWETDK